MSYTRRDLSLLLPALLAAAEAQADTAALPSKTFAFEDLTLKGKGRAVLDGKNHKGVGIECHETQLAPGEIPHAAHHHEHIELVMIREGLMEVTINGKSTRLGPGGVAYLASNDEHGWKNVGDKMAHYFVIAVGRERT